MASIAIYAGPDEGAPYTVLADEAVPLAGTGPADTYLSAGKLLAAAEQAGADSVHPGYGFLAENADFAQAVLEAGLTWIGPPPDVIRVLGDKVRARAIAAQAGAPLVPGTSEPVAEAAEVMRFAERHGLPLAIKAAHGAAAVACGSPARPARSRRSSTRRSAKPRPRSAGASVSSRPTSNVAGTSRRRSWRTPTAAVLVAGTRECTLQRRYQKLVEEAPAPCGHDRPVRRGSTGRACPVRRRRRPAG